MTRQCRAVALVVLALAPVVAAQKNPPLEDILRTAATYVTDYSERLQAVVADESYLQLEVSGGATRMTRRIVSEVAFVGAGMGRVAFYRDVHTLDGKSVRDDASRLLRLLQPLTNASLASALQLTQDGGRYYVSPRLQVFDELLGPLALLRQENQTKATFKLEGIKKADGADIATLHFAEVARSHVINSPIDEPATGRLVLDVRTGAFRRTELVISNRNVNFRITVVYALEPARGLWLPSSMTAQADVSAGGMGSQDSRGQFLNERESLEASATYAKFRTPSR